MKPTLALLAVMSTVNGLAASSAYAEPGEIKGQDVMGDKEKSAPDGWSQAPVPREESAAKDASNPGGSSSKENAEQPASNPGSTSPSK